MKYLLILSLILIGCADKKVQPELVNCYEIIDNWPNDNIEAFPNESLNFNPVCEFPSGTQCEIEEIGDKKHLNFYCNYK